MNIKFKINLPAMRRVLSRKVTAVVGRTLSTAQSRVADIVRERVIALAQKEVPGMAKRYRDALRAPGAVTFDGRGVRVKITDPLVQAVERGAKAFDMKPRLLAKAKMSRGGKLYVDVPFRHKTASIPSAARAAMLSAAGPAGDKAVKMSSKTPGRAFTRQLNRGRIGQALGLSPKKQRVQHKQGVQDDLMRKPGKRLSSGKRAGRYSTVRRISLSSAASSWWHPGFKRADLVGRALRASKREISIAVRESISVRKP